MRERYYRWRRLSRTLLLLPILCCFFTTDAGLSYVRTIISGNLISWESEGAVLNLTLGCNAPLEDFTCWNEASEFAAGAWNEKAQRFSFFVLRQPLFVDPCDNVDGLNTVAWTSSICGKGFGGALAVTALRTDGNGNIQEVEVLVNIDHSWNGYLGPLESTTSGEPLNDLYRTLIHEYGHVLGLDHPNDHGQNKTAIMDSRRSDLFKLQSDDIAGVNAIYSEAQFHTLSVTTKATFVSNTAQSSANNTFIMTRQNTIVDTQGGLTFRRCTLSGSPVDGATHVGNCKWATFTDRGATLRRFSFNFRIPGTSGHWGEFILVNTRRFGRFVRFRRPAGGVAVGAASGKVAWDFK